MLEIEESRGLLLDEQDPWSNVSRCLTDDAGSKKQPVFENEKTPSLPEFKLTERTLEVEVKQKKLDATKELFGDLPPETAICPDACIQPIIGNCYFVAAMASVAKMDPELIKNMIKVNDDGTYTVTFPGLGKSYTVGKPTKDDIALLNGGIGKYGTWPIILMKAFGQHYGGGKDGKSEIRGGDHGSLFSAGMKAFYKEGVKNFGIGAVPHLMSYQRLQDRLVELLSPDKPEKGIPVTGSTKRWENGKNLVKEHVYSVLKIEPNKDDPGMGIITIRNPHGQEGCVSTLTVAEFRRIFMQLSYPEHRKK